MQGALAAADAVTWAAILTKALLYAATLIAAGSVMVHATLRSLDDTARRYLGRLAAGMALAAAVFAGLLLPLRASFLMGGGLSGAFDTMMLRMVAESSLGTSVAILLLGLAFIPAILSRIKAIQLLAVPGAVLACASFAFRGHATGEPREILGALVTLHILGLAFWAGGLAPLLRALRTAPAGQAGRIAHEFGQQALGVVSGLGLAGGLTFVLLGAASPAALTTPYGQFFALKLTFFLGTLGLATVNKLWLTPALLAEAPDAPERLHRSILIEAVALAAILSLTAALTSLTAPPTS